MERALCNAFAINATKFTDIFPIVCSANCLQVQGQNDNGWDQGLVFMDSDEVWLQPPALAAKLLGSGWQKNRIAYTAESSVDINFAASASEDGKTIVITVVNRYTSQQTLWVDCDRFGSMTIQSLAASLGAVNTASSPSMVAIGDTVSCDGPTATLPANSVNVITVSLE